MKSAPAFLASSWAIFKPSSDLRSREDIRNHYRHVHAVLGQRISSTACLFLSCRSCHSLRRHTQGKGKPPGGSPPARKEMEKGMDNPVSDLQYRVPHERVQNEWTASLNICSASIILKKEQFQIIHNMLKFFPNKKLLLLFSTIHYIIALYYRCASIHIE